MLNEHHSKNEVKLRKYFILLFSVITALTLIVFGIWYILYKDVVQGILEFSIGIILLINIYFLLVKNTIDISAKILVFFVMFISLVVFINGGIENTGNLWSILVPMFPLLLLHYKDGLKWLYIYSLIFITIIVFNIFDIITLKFNLIELRQTLIVYILFSILLYYNEKIKYNARVALQKSDKELREKEQLLFTQSKNAQMGEMLSMIAHQWRQPLNAISASSISLELKYSMNVFTENDILEHTKFIQENTQKMSKTIDDFMNFFKPEEEKVDFTIKSSIEEILSLIGTQLKSRGIELIFNIENDIFIHSYKKELSHILINLITNARDAYEGNNIESKTIEIVATKENTLIIIKVIDKAGGIPTTIRDKIFNPYFTTKEQGKGTGIGLYMTKKILEEIFNGNISVENKNSGAIFTITFLE